jgi:hypothetical protein
LSSRKQDTIIGTVLVGVVVLMMGIALYTSQPEVYPLLDPVPRSETPPEDYDSVETIQVGTLLLNATANATGMIPHQGPMTFRMSLKINITNMGSENINSFRAVRMSVYSNDSELFYTFSFQYDWNATIPLGETVALIYRNHETRIEVPFEPRNFYVRVLVTFNPDYEAILTTPLIHGSFAME